VRCGIDYAPFLGKRAYLSGDLIVTPDGVLSTITRGGTGNFVSLAVLTTTARD